MRAVRASVRACAPPSDGLSSIHTYIQEMEVSQPHRLVQLSSSTEEESRLVIPPNTPLIRATHSLHACARACVCMWMEARYSPPVTLSFPLPSCRQSLIDSNDAFLGRGGPLSGFSPERPRGAARRGGLGGVLLLLLLVMVVVSGRGFIMSRYMHMPCGFFFFLL